MDGLDAQVLNTALNWAATGHRFILVTVARTWGSAPRPPGAWMVVRDDGQVRGSVSGGCIEDDLIRRVAAREFEDSVPRLLRYGVTADEARRFGLPCGGSLELLLEPAPDAVLLEQLAQRTASGQLVRRRISLVDGTVSLEGGHVGDCLQWDGAKLITLHGPVWRLLLIGAGQISHYLATMAQALGYRVHICDPRREYADAWDVSGTERIALHPDEAVATWAPDPRSAVVALTHDPKLDDLALLEALKSPAFYVGALGSHANNRKRRERLLQHFDLSQAEIDRLHGPVGLAIGSRTPPEIAVSILAEMTAVKNGLVAVSIERRTDPFACQIG